MINRIFLMVVFFASVVFSTDNYQVFICDENNDCMYTNNTAFIEVNEKVVLITYDREDKGRLGLDLFSERYDVISVSKTSVTVSDESLKIVLSEGCLSIYDVEDNYTMLYIMPNVDVNTLTQYKFD